MQKLFAGIDEAGKGPLAGPVAAACVVMSPESHVIAQVKDSKKLSPAQRERLYPQICEQALAYSIVMVGPRRIEDLNILGATELAMRLCAERTFRSLKSRGLVGNLGDMHFLVDGNRRIPGLTFQDAIVKGDEKIPSIGAASILAKVARDRVMDVLDTHFPCYEFARHKGYPTARHRELIRCFGVSRVHRCTFKGVVEFCGGIES